MKKKYIYQLYWCFTFTALLIFKANSQSTGDIAFVGFNADGDKDFSIAVLADIPSNSIIYFNDKESDGMGSFKASEGTIKWTTGDAIINSGTIVTFTDVDNASNTNFGASIGTIERDGSFNISSSKDNIFAFLGTDADTPTTFLAALQIGNDDTKLGPFDADGITLSSTGLVIGSSIIVVAKTASPDGGKYIGSKSNQTAYSDYYTQLSDTNNWTTSTTNGESLLPFSPEAFTISATTWNGSESDDWSNSSNWSNGIPTINSNTSIPNSANSPEVKTATSAVSGNIVLDAGSVLTVIGNLNLKGVAIINSNDMKSGSLLLNGTLSGTMIYNRFLNTTNWYLVSSPVLGQKVAPFARTNSLALGSGSGNDQNIALATYDNIQTNINDRWNYYTEGEIDGLSNDDTDHTLISGQGYAVKTQSSGTISFMGAVVNSDFTNLSLTNHLGAGGTAFSLLGNPYPSYIAANNAANAIDNILSINSSLLSEETIWLWNQSTDSYDAFNNISDLHIAPGQGFFVSANGNSSTFSITEAMQSHQNSDTFQKSTSINSPNLLLTLTQGNIIRQSKVYYIDKSSKGFDNGYDSTLFEGAENSFVIYTRLIDNSSSQNLSIQSIPNKNFEEMIIPIGIKATSGTEITIAAEAFNFPLGIHLYLEDKKNNSFTRLDSANTGYTTILSKDLNGVGRFYLYTTNSALNINNDDAKITIYSNQNSINIEGLYEKAILKVHSILGNRVVRSSFLGNGFNKIKLPPLQKGVYFIELETQKETINKKIIIH